MHGAHLFRIVRYSLYKGIGVGECIRSTTFFVGGHDWCFCFFLDGDKEENKDWVSVYLELKTDDVVARTVYDLT
jgi:speckle-type POZ protein